MLFIFLPVTFLFFLFQFTVNGWSDERDRNEFNGTSESSCNTELVPLSQQKSVAPHDNFRELEGYLSGDSFLPKEEIGVHVHAPNGYFTYSIVSLTDNEVIVPPISQPGQKQGIPRCSVEQGAQWAETLRIKTGDLQSGLYAVEIQDFETTAFLPFVVKDSNPNPPPITVLVNTNTWVAYNSWGGGGLYEWVPESNFTSKYCCLDFVATSETTPFPLATLVSKHRPYSNPAMFDESSHLLGGELHLLKWLDKENLAYSLITDSDLDSNPEVLKHTKIFVLNTHPEYWTASMMNSLDVYLKNQGNIIYLGGNALYWKTVVNDSQLESMRDSKRHSLEQSPGGLWKDLGVYAAQKIGVEYDGLDFGTQSPFVVTNHKHWVLDGTGLTDGDFFGTDTAIDSPWKNVVTKDVFPAKIGASGWETDKISDFSPQQIIRIAKGQNPNGGADIIFFENEWGGKVFSAGSLTFTGALTNDETVRVVIKNVFDNFLK